VIQLRRQVMRPAGAIGRDAASPEDGELLYDPVSNAITSGRSMRALDEQAAPPDVAGAALLYYFTAPQDGVMPAFNWELTYACTWRCRHCFQPTVPAGDPEVASAGAAPSPGAVMIAGEVIERVSALLRDLRVPELSLTGGEVLLVANLAEVVARLRAAVPGLSLRVLLSGRNLPKRVAAAGLLPVLAAAHACIRVPLYGPTPEVHDWVTRTPGSFDDVVGLVALAQEAGVRVHLGVQVLRETYPYLAGTLRLAHELEGSDFALSAIVYPPHHGDGGDHGLNADQLMQLLRTRGTAAAATDYISSGCGRCRSGCQHPTIDPGGALRSCDIGGRRMGRLGDNPEGLAACLYSPWTEATTDCDVCELSGVCKRCPAFLQDGHCPAGYRMLVAAAAAVVEHRIAAAQRLGWSAAEPAAGPTAGGAVAGG
jgi:MoaA/NifB/PqqE/SkfB family radical SAM enzyme